MPDASGEQLWSTANGTVDGVPVRLRLTDAGLSMQLASETAPRPIPLHQVTDVAAQVGLLTGFVTLTVRGETITVARVPKAEARAFVDALEAQLRHLPDADPEPEPAPASTPTGDASPLAELERLARLRDSGALTDEEFQAAKRTLLGRL